MVGQNVFLKQCKEVLSKKNILKIINCEPEYVLLSRTTSTETYLNQLPGVDYIQGTCVRFVIWYAEVTNNKMIKNIRISLDNLARLDKGVMIEQYRMRFELEYNEGSLNFDEVDGKLYEIINTFKHLYFPIVSPPTPELLMMCPSRPFSCFHESTLANHCLYVPKLDGFRAKLGVYPRGGGVCYVDDTNRFAVGSAEILSRFEGFIFQLEILAPESKAVVTDILGVYVNKTLYSAPIENVFQIFRQLRDIQERQTCWLKLKSDNQEYCFELSFQQALEYDDIESYKSLPTDGTIVISNDKLFKLKALTFDARYKKGCFYLDEEMRSLHQDDANEYIERGIYELCLMPGGIRVVRHREDRRTTDSLKKYLKIVKEFNHITELHQT